MRSGPARMLTMFLAVTFLMACGSPSSDAPQESPASDENRLRVVTTIYPVSYFAERVGGDRVEVVPIVATGALAHDFEPRPSHISLIQGSDLVIYTHPSFESWMAGALESVRSNVVALAAADPADIPATEHSEDLDPHVWLNPEKAERMVERIRASLAAADPGGEAVYRANAGLLTLELRDREARIRATLSSCGLKIAVVSHEAYGHLLDGFGIEQVGLSGSDADQEANPGTLAKIVDLMRANGIRYVLVEPVISQRLAEQVASTVGASLMVLDPLESLTDEGITAGDNYFSIMDRNLESLRTALECQR